MGHEILPALSPAHRRIPNPSSPAAVFKKPMREEPDLGWKALIQRHQFLLFMLALLTFLCTIYLYFAITLGAGGACVGLRGAQKALCQLSKSSPATLRRKAGGRSLLWHQPEMQSVLEIICESQACKVQSRSLSQLSHSDRIAADSFLATRGAISECEEYRYKDERRFHILYFSFQTITPWRCSIRAIREIQKQDCRNLSIVDFPASQRIFS